MAVGSPVKAEDTRVIMQRTLDSYGAGIEVRSVNITDVQVPEAVQQAQRDSVKAKADRERMIKEAQAYANGILPKAQGDAEQRVVFDLVTQKPGDPKEGILVTLGVPASDAVRGLKLMALIKQNMKIN